MFSFVAAVCWGERQSLTACAARVADLVIPPGARLLPAWVWLTIVVAVFLWWLMFRTHWLETLAPLPRLNVRLEPGEIADTWDNGSPVYGLRGM